MRDEYRYRFFFFNDTATTEIYTLSLHDALPIFPEQALHREEHEVEEGGESCGDQGGGEHAPNLVGPCADFVELRVPQQSAGGDRKSTRLNSSHANISYAVFCLKKKYTQHQSSYQ